MIHPELVTPEPLRPLRDAVSLDPSKVLIPENLDGITGDAPVLVLLAAGKGTRFGAEPKCIQAICGVPLAGHSIEAFRHVSLAPPICIVGYCSETVSAALGTGNIYVHSDNPAGGTGFAAFEALCVRSLQENPLLVISMGDRIVPSGIFRRICEKHSEGEREADLTFLTAQYEPPRNRGKGRVLRGDGGMVQRIVEERDIVSEDLLSLTEGNCPLYVIRAATLQHFLQRVTNANAQGQYYLTDIVDLITQSGGDVRTITVTSDDPEYELVCADVTHPGDIAVLERILEERELDQAARAITLDRPSGQVASIARQLRELTMTASAEKLGFEPDRPVAIGISGGRLRIAFMHPDMTRFFGPAWQMPIGARDAEGSEQITMLVQAADDRRIHLFPINLKFRERINSIPADSDAMYPDDAISDWHAYEPFGTHVSEIALLSLGYFSDAEVENRRAKGQPLPPPSLWISNNMRRPFALVDNAIASMRTMRTGAAGAKVQQHLGRKNFVGLRLISTGSIPEGGFSSSSAVTVATENAINALWEFGLSPDMLVQLACQAEYGTGVRAGSLDQAAEQKGRTGQGTLISSNPRDNYCVIGTYPVPARIQILFPYTVDRDRTAWRWSYGFYGEAAGSGPLTTGEIRKLTGKAAEIAAIITQLPKETDFFKVIENDLLSDGLLSRESRVWICSILRQLPLLASKSELRERLGTDCDWLFEGWREPERGVPLRAMLAYLFGEVAKNFYLIHHPDEWIETVTRSQWGDRCVNIDPQILPARDVMEGQLDWERGHTGPELMNLWLERHDATAFDYNRGLDDESLAAAEPPEFHRLEGSNFFRGLALIDLAEAMLKRAFGDQAVAMRVNAAGQGDYFQVHVDTGKIDTGAVKDFLRKAFYRRFGLSPEPEFVEIHPGGGALGVRLSRYRALTQLIAKLERETVPSSPIL